jgi:glycosyltransferase involved in cell wall biosynthesis
MTPAPKREHPLVAFVSDATEFAGAEQYMVMIVDALRGDFDFVLVASDRAPDETRERAAGAGAEIVVVRGLQRRPTPGSTLRLARALRRLRPDLIHINMSDQGGALTAFLAAGLAPGRNLATLHNAMPNREAWKEHLSAATMRRADVVIAVSDQLGLYLESRRVAGAVVKHGLWPPSLNPHARRLLGLGSDEFVVGGIGRLHNQKGWDTLCRAAALVHESRPDIRFVVIGEGEERSALEHEPGYGDVEFRGYMADASSLLSAFDLLVIPSRYEGLGLVAIEAMLAGIPIVAARISIFGEVIGEAGRLVSPESPERLAEAIVELAGDPAQRKNLVERAAERARGLFDPGRMADETRMVYESVIAGNYRPGGELVHR